MDNLKPNEERAKYAIVMIWIVMGLKLITIVSDFFQYRLLISAQNGEIYSAEMANANDLRQQVIVILFVISYIISSVTFIMWFRRAYFNLHQKTGYLDYSEGWASGAWFVPIVNLYRPYKIMRELYVETKELLTKKLISFDQELSLTFVGIWWTLWIIATVFGQVISQLARRAVLIDTLAFYTMMDMIHCGLILVCGFFAIKVIKDYSTVEPLLFHINDDNEQGVMISNNQDTLD